MCSEDAASLRKERLNGVLQRLIPEIASKYQPEKIILFGSLADGRVSAYSDIDLALVKRTQAPYCERILELLKLIHEDDGEPVDYFVYTPEELKFETEHNPFVREEIVRKGKVLYDVS